MVRVTVAMLEKAWTTLVKRMPKLRVEPGSWYRNTDSGPECCALGLMMAVGRKPAVRVVGKGKEARWAEQYPGQVRLDDRLVEEAKRRYGQQYVSGFVDGFDDMRAHTLQSQQYKCGKVDGVKARRWADKHAS